MNILLINVNIGKSWGWGGIESHSDLLADMLSMKGHRVVMGCWVEGTVCLSSGRVLPARRITIRNSGDLRAILRIIGVCRAEQVDVVIANGGREYWPAAVASKIAGRKVVFIRHQTDPLRITTRLLANRYVDKIVAVSDAVRNALRRSGIRPGSIETIYNSVDLRRFHPNESVRAEAREELSLVSGDTVVGTLGKLNRGKGVFELLGAVGRLAERHPRLKLLFVGEGPDGAALKQQAEYLALSDRVIFTGRRDDVERMYAAMDVFVLPSTCDEAFGMVLIEAMAMGKPVIGTTVGGIPDIIRDGINGILVPPGDDEALAAALSRYLDDGRFGEQMADRGRKTVEERFSGEIMAERFDRLLSEVMAG